jgi:ElaB/YqjD/DUF883 family membrane-anchored ribosome-binding protein
MVEDRTAHAELDSVGEAQAAVDHSRERLSETLDVIEDRIVETKSALRDRIDVLRPVRERVREHPWLAVAAASGIGLVLGKVLGRERHRDRVASPRRTGTGSAMRRELRKQLLAALTGAIAAGVRARLLHGVGATTERSPTRAERAGQPIG